MGRSQKNVPGFQGRFRPGRVCSGGKEGKIGLVTFVAGAFEPEFHETPASRSKDGQGTLARESKRAVGAGSGVGMLQQKLSSFRRAADALSPLLIVPPDDHTSERLAGV